MFWSYMLNIPLAFAMLLVFLFAMTDVATATTEVFPLVWVLQNSLSTAGATAITSLMFILIFMIETSCYASTSRQTFAFARDDGLPFSAWMKKVYFSLHRTHRNLLMVSVGQAQPQRRCQCLLRDLGLHCCHVPHLSREHGRIQRNVSWTHSVI